MNTELLRYMPPNAAAVFGLLGNVSELKKFAKL